MIDARGQLCPMPVIMVQKAAKENPAEIQVLVDDPCAVDNITRFAGNNGYQITSANKDTITKRGKAIGLASLRYGCVPSQNDADQTAASLVEDAFQRLPQLFLRILRHPL